MSFLLRRWRYNDAVVRGGGVERVLRWSVGDPTVVQRSSSSSSSSWTRRRWCSASTTATPPPFASADADRAPARTIGRAARAREPGSAALATRLLDERAREILPEWDAASFYDGSLETLSLEGRVDADAPTRESSFVRLDRGAFHAVLRAWATSKVRRKGLEAEALLARMVELGTSLGRDDLLPDSKAFALTIQCHAGSTHPRSSFERVRTLSEAHDAYAARGVPGADAADPLLLRRALRSLTATRRRWREAEARTALDWARRWRRDDDDDGRRTDVLVAVARRLARSDRRRVRGRTREVLDLLGDAAPIDALNAALSSIRGPDEAEAFLRERVAEPNDRSFALCLRARDAGGGRDAARARRLLDESRRRGVATALVYDEALRDAPFAEATRVLDDMRDDGVAPEATTYELASAACVAPGDDDDDDEERRRWTESLFADAAARDLVAPGTVVHLARSRLSVPSTSPAAVVEPLFRFAAARGLVSGGVLDLLRANSSPATFRDVVGDGRLPDAWIARVPTTARDRVSYTDGSNGGPGRTRARRGAKKKNDDRRRRAR